MYFSLTFRFLKIFEQGSVVARKEVPPPPIKPKPKKKAKKSLPKDSSEEEQEEEEAEEVYKVFFCFLPLMENGYLTAERRRGRRRKRKAGTQEKESCSKTQGLKSCFEEEGGSKESKEACSC